MQSSQLSTVKEPILLANSYTVAVKNSYLENQLTTSNKFINFGQPILLLCTKIIQGYYPNESSTLKLNITHEINIFVNKCKSHKITSSSIAIAQYALISTIKDILIDKDIDFDTVEHKQLLVEPFTELLTYLLKYPEEHIELLELLFICYKFGFRDNYLIDHHLAFDHLEQIYFTIRQTTGKISKNLHREPMQINSSQTQSHTSKITSKFSLLLGIVGIGSIIISSLLMEQHLSLLNHQISAGLNNLSTYHKYE